MGTEERAVGMRMGSARWHADGQCSMAMEDSTEGLSGGERGPPRARQPSLGPLPQSSPYRSCEPPSGNIPIAAPFYM